jgi:hypothetical protein
VQQYVTAVTKVSLLRSSWSAAVRILIVAALCSRGPVLFEVMNTFTVIVVIVWEVLPLWANIEAHGIHI